MILYICLKDEMIVFAFNLMFKLKQKNLNFECGSSRHRDTPLFVPLNQIYI